MARNDTEIRFLPSYVGSKRAWLTHSEITPLKGRPFVELFAGSAVLSANLASKALLNDYDPIVAYVLAHFDEQIVPFEFSRDDYYTLRKDTAVDPESGMPEWVKHLYCLQSISYSGVFRWSQKGGYNVPAKGGPDNAKNAVNSWRHIRPAYDRALVRWQQLGLGDKDESGSPLHVRQGSYIDVPIEEMLALGDPVVIMDPPYEASQAAYNTNHFDYDEYWSHVKRLRSAGLDVVLFDRAANVEARGYKDFIRGERKMRVNGARDGDIEVMAVLPKE